MTIILEARNLTVTTGERAILMDEPTSSLDAKSTEAIEELIFRLKATHTIILVFNEGYSASSGASLTRSDLSGEAIRLGRLLLELLPEPEVMGLLALMLLQESRRAARVSLTGDLILLEDQDRSLWNRETIAEGQTLVERALSSRRFGPYTLQAAIAAVHAEATDALATDWAQIVALYSLLVRVEPSPVVELNRAVAVAVRDGPEAGLKLMDAILARGELAEYHLAHSARADLHRRLGKTAEARSSYERALAPINAPAVFVLAPPIDGPAGSILALLEGGESWSTPALACALGSSQRTVQRALRQLEETAAVGAVGRGRSRRWLAPALGGFATTLLLPGALPVG